MKFEVILLAAGASRRMQGVDKLLQQIDGEALLRRAAKAAQGSAAGCVHVVVPAGDVARQKTLDTLAVQVVEAEDWQCGMAASVRAGLRAVSPDCDAVIISLADMPEVVAMDYDRLMEAFDPSAGADICRAVTVAGVPGHPVLFGRRFFAALAELNGDCGARDVLRGAPEVVLDVVTGEGAVIDLDTPRDWAKWRLQRK